MPVSTQTHDNAGFYLPASLNAAMETSAAPTLADTLRGYNKILCAIEPDAAGRQLLWRVSKAACITGSKIAVVSVARFEMPLDASACLRPTPLDRRARLVHQRQREIDELVNSLELSNVEVFATAGIPRRQILELARSWGADLVIHNRSSRFGLRRKQGRQSGSFDVMALGNDGQVIQPPWLVRLLGI